MLAEGISDIVTKPHGAQSGFANNDLNHRRKARGAKKIVMLDRGECLIESTGRFGIAIVAIASLSLRMR